MEIVIFDILTQAILSIDCREVGNTKGRAFKSPFWQPDTKRALSLSLSEK